MNLNKLASKHCLRGCLTFPAEIFERVFKELLPEFERKCHSRKQRPLPESIQFARTKFERVWAGDGSTLEAIFRKLDSLATLPTNKLAGKIGVVIDLVTRIGAPVRRASALLLQLYGRDTRPYNCNAFRVGEQRRARTATRTKLTEFNRTVLGSA